MNKLISPSLLSADFGNLDRDIVTLNHSDADWFHLDIMDGVFVPNISFGFPVIKFINKLAEKPLDFHLMIVEPDKFVNQVRDCGASIMNVHYEACTHLHRTIQNIHNAGMKAGVTLNPHTSVELLRDVICDVDLVLLMSVNPGFGGQKFIEHTFDKLARLRQMMDECGSMAMIQIDGGVNKDNSQRLYQLGADCLVAGNAVFKGNAIDENIRLIKGL